MAVFAIIAAVLIVPANARAAGARSSRIIAQRASGPRTSKHAAAAASQLSVDLVKLRSGKTLRGGIARQNDDGSLTMAVSRDWLLKFDASLASKRLKDETSVQRTALEQLRDRLDKELAGRPEESPLAIFFRRERKRIEERLAQPASPEPPQFVWIDLKQKQVAKIVRASIERRRIACWSWYERLANVETRDAAGLDQELKHKRIDATQPPPDLSDRFPLRIQDDREWSARLALLTYALEKPLDFQGAGDMLVRSDRSAKAPDMASVIAQLFGGSLNSLLKELTDAGRATATTAESADDWLKPATREAEREKARAFRATRVHVNLGARQATVESVLAVQLDNAKWETIWSARETEDGTKIRASMEAAIGKDARVKSALGVLNSLGAASDDQIQQSIRFGAATMTAQQAVDRQFSAFEEPLLQRLDGPPLWWMK
jgi:hypothetical protein